MASTTFVLESSSASLALQVREEYSSNVRVTPSGFCEHFADEFSWLDKALISARATASTALAASFIFLAAINLISAVFILLFVCSISDNVLKTSDFAALPIFLNCSASELSRWSSLEISTGLSEPPFISASFAR
ncbi:hypothetical protein OIU77_020498 [Salix suchowensis]|uniref:Uncharacterized protein n=1 Tax=Salix suchowensis TaxID=1278906 RepID=A0ABQ9C9T5_9ROSI|nr:hypothetical protein OIU77_020498 [Salix suchowensis]